MRSRNGNNSSSFSAFIIFIISIFFSSVSLLADEYLISYHYSVHNAILYNEELFISKAMTKCKGISGSTILTLENNNSNTLPVLLKQNYDKFISYLNRVGMLIEYNNKTSNGKSNTTTQLTFKTHCFKVDFNDNFAKISALK